MSGLGTAKQPEVVEATEQIYADLQAAGIETLYDDRDERAGVKFNDADLLGIPLRLTVGGRGIKSGQLELKLRRDGTSSRCAARRCGRHAAAHHCRRDGAH